MPYNGVGQFTSLGAPTFPAVAGNFILASYFNATLNDVFTGLSTALPRDGQAAMTGNLPMATFKITGLGDGTVAQDAVTYGQVFDGGTFTDPTLAGNVAVTGVATFSQPVDLIIGSTVAGYAPLASPALTGVPTAPTAALGTNTTQLATMAALLAQAFVTALPSQTGNAGKMVITDGVNASWGFPVITHVAGVTASAVAGSNLSLENVAATVVTANATPVDAEEFSVTANNGLITNTVDFGTLTLRGPAGSLNIVALDTPYVPWRFKFNATTNFWTVL